jgi:inhibitor of KinA sporulation pathway (predicted exonuclease)
MHLNLNDYKTLVILDVEITAWQGSQERNWSLDFEEKELIQIGMLAFNQENLEIIDDFSCYIKPTVNPELSDYIIALTGIEQATIDNEGIGFEKAMQRSVDFLNSLPEPVHIIHNGIDGLVVRENAALLGIEPPEYFRNTSSIRPYLQHHLSNMSKTLVSFELSELVGVQLDGHPHNALFDVYSIYAALQFLRSKTLTK